MPIDIPTSCTCGAITGCVRGVTWANARRLSCLCDDCQAYAHYLGRTGDILDAHGGTDLSYATQARVEISTGAELLAAVRLYAKGILRVYASCCRTPVAHVPSPKLAFVGIPHLFMRSGPRGETRDEMLGPLVHRLQARFCRGEMPRGAHPGTPFGLWAAAALNVIWDSLCSRQTPSAFHDAQSGEPVVQPTVLSAAELARLRGDSSSAAAFRARRRVPAGCT